MRKVSHDGPDYIERDRDLSLPIVSALIDNGLFRLLQPRSLGGAELDPMTYVQVVEAIARHDASIGWCVEQGERLFDGRRVS